MRRMHSSLPPASGPQPELAGAVAFGLILQGNPIADCNFEVKRHVGLTLKVIYCTWAQGVQVAQQGMNSLYIPFEQVLRPQLSLMPASGAALCVLA